MLRGNAVVRIGRCLTLDSPRRYHRRASVPVDMRERMMPSRICMALVERFENRDPGERIVGWVERALARDTHPTPSSARNDGLRADQATSYTRRVGGRADPSCDCFYGIASRRDDPADAIATVADPRPHRADRGGRTIPSAPGGVPRLGRVGCLRLAQWMAPRRPWQPSPP